MKKVFAIFFITLIFSCAVQASTDTSVYDEETWTNIEMDGNFGPADC